MNVIFLDIDGVLVTRQSLQKGQSGLRAKADPRAVIQLNRVLKATEAQLVISSTWRFSMGPEQLQTVLCDEWGVQGHIVGTTPTCLAAVGGIVIATPRGVEIQAWLDFIKQSSFLAVEKFVIVDDDSDMGHLTEYLVQTSMDNGLTPAHADEIIRRLR